MTKILLTALLLTTTAMAYEYGPDPRYTGAPGDNPLACSNSMCHSSLAKGGPINANAGFGVTAAFSSGSSYTPGGAPITIVISVSDPVNTHFGFQLTARLESDLANAQAGDFTTGTTPGCPAVAAPCELVLCDDGSVKANGKTCPASSPVQFIEHSFPKGSQVSTQPYTVTWTPPATNAGPVHFYLAGNAVNGDLNASGLDHVYTAEFTLTPVLCSVSTPSISNIISAGAFGELPTFASGSWIEIYGSNFASGTWQWQGIDFTGVNAPTSLAGIQVSVGGKPAYVSFLDPGQINVQAPADATLGQVPMVVKSCASGSPPFPLEKDALAPGLFSPPSYFINGKQYLAATFNSDKAIVGDPTLIPGASRPAKAGDVITAYGTGFGGVQATDGTSIAPGVVAGSMNTLTTPITVAFGSAAATLMYDGLAPGNVGLYQFNIVVPQTPNGDTPINMTLNGTPLVQNLFLTVKN